MILDFRKIARTGKTEEEFFFEYVPREDLLSIPDAEIVSPVKINGKITLTGKHSAFVDAEVCFTIKGSCTRCLKDTEKTYFATIEEEFDQDDEYSYPVKNDTVDLSTVVEDKIIMTAPVSFLCREDCKGICYVCGKDLNEGACNHEK
jgi:uncharacterized protein